MKERILIVEDEFMLADHLQKFLKKEKYDVCGVASSYEEALRLVDEQQPTWVLLDIFLKGKGTGIDLANVLTERDIPFIYLSANTTQETLEAAKKTQPYGFMAKPFRDKELMIMLDIAMYRHERITETRQLKTETALERLSNLLPKSADKPNGKLLKFAMALQSLVSFDVLCIATEQNPTTPATDIYIVRSGLHDYFILPQKELLKQFRMNAKEYALDRKLFFDDSQPGLRNDLDFRRLKMDNLLLKSFGRDFQIESKLSHLFDFGPSATAITFFSQQHEGYSPNDSGTLEKFSANVKKILSNIFSDPASGNIASVSQTDVSGSAERDSYSKAFEGIIGNSSKLLSVLDHLKIVAPTTTSVLITGESGTGKERIAQAVHELSPRKDMPLVIVNCAVLPGSLIESELFGHEKGSFTGAGEKRIGKFEMAQGGTIFLDEIGEMPMESQVKLLRVLQEKEIERIGGNQRIKVDVRIIAATNRNMEKEVAEGRFRLDLYYRLNVFPLELPSLRERRDDIPQLAEHFAKVYSAENGKNVTGVSPMVLNQMMGYTWPGNIRELGHIMERSVLLAKGSEVTEVFLPKSANAAAAEEQNGDYVKSFDENERDHILYVLRKCVGRVAGKGGAAELLKVPPTTLTSKIKRLGILRKHISPDEQQPPGA